MKQIIENYQAKCSLSDSKLEARGTSASPKHIITEIFKNNSLNIQVLDIGFGDGNLGEMIKNDDSIKHWSIDGVDGFAPNCNNKQLISKNIYRNIWHGLAQEIPLELFQQYDLICLLDIIEHLDAKTAKNVLHTLLSNMNDNAYLFISTPLWFYPQDQNQESDLEEHLIGIPATSMMALIPKMYYINYPLVGGFILDKKSLEYIEFFQPTEDKSFSYEKGLTIVNTLKLEYHEPTNTKQPWYKKIMRSIKKRINFIKEL